VTGVLVGREEGVGKEVVAEREESLEEEVVLDEEDLDPLEVAAFDEFPDHVLSHFAFSSKSFE
jgi:hypothetical protein